GSADALRRGRRARRSRSRCRGTSRPGARSWVQVPRQLVDERRGPALIGGEPPDPWIPPEPDHLPARELSRPPHRALDGLLERQPALEVPRELSVPDGPARGEPPEETAIQEPAHLLQQPAPQHRLHPSTDPSGQNLGR